MDVVCVGQALVDCITRGQEEKEYKKHVYRAESISLSTGGDALNEAMILASMGENVRLVCGLGDDLAGKLVMSRAQDFGIDMSYAKISRELSTPIANLMVSCDGSRKSVNSKATMLSGYEPNPAAFQGAKVVSFASLFRAPLDQPKVVRHLMQQAKEAGAIICADTKMPTYRTMSPEEIQTILPYIDYLFPNENEAAYYTQVEDGDYQRMGSIFREAGVKNVIIKTGEKGCEVFGEQETFHLDAQKVEVLDSTGAGDNFVAGCIHALLQGQNLRQCCTYGTRCAAQSVQHIGAVAGDISMGE